MRKFFIWIGLLAALAAVCLMAACTAATGAESESAASASQPPEGPQGDSVPSMPGGPVQGEEDASGLTPPEMAMLEEQAASSRPTPPEMGDAPPEEPFALNWETLSADWATAMEKEEVLAAEVQRGGPVFTLVATVPKNTSKAEAETLAETMLRLYNDTAAAQDSTIQRATGSSYGGLFEEYTALVGVRAEGAGDDREDWLFYRVVDAGSHSFREVDA